MQSFFSKAWRFLVSEEGPTAVEYAVMLLLVILVCLAAVHTFGVRTNQLFQYSASQMPGS